ncbi:hypothetical protein NKJ73_33240 [Mesorhizobium sp. M0074]|uniref:hypothetical protein n=1 Tax=Mesorhizobium sp. M0074 TaxID=2956869 RepID=UPI00333AA2CF
MIDLAPQDVALADAATDTPGKEDLLAAQAAGWNAGIEDGSNLISHNASKVTICSIYIS